MALDEFELINDYFATRTIARADVIVGIGDDAALLRVPQHCDLVVSIDTLISGVHFPETTLPDDIAYKALAVNLSDLAAMGATPAWVTLALTLPAAEPDWLHAFSRGFFELMDTYSLQLIGGDTTRADRLSITLQVHGFVPIKKALRRSGAKPGDNIYVTGTLGDAGYALALLNNRSHLAVSSENRAYFDTRLNRPVPRVLFGLGLRDLANSAIDISDGFLADLEHLLKQSQVGARVDVGALPISSQLATCSTHEASQWALSSGDDYELCFTAAASQHAAVEALAAAEGCRVTCVGQIEADIGLRLFETSGAVVVPVQKGYRHF